MRSRRRDGNLMIADDGDGYVIFQCQCGCEPMDIAAALPKRGIWPFDPHVVEWNGAPALRTRVTGKDDDTGVNKRRARR
jgi:hypothetical protein